MALSTHAYRVLIWRKQSDAVSDPFMHVTSLGARHRRSAATQARADPGCRPRPRAP